MLNKYYKIKFKSFIIPFIIWGIWIGGWSYAPAEELVWPPLKWIFIGIFAPIGVILLGALTGHRIKIIQDKLRFGFIPFIRTIPFSKIKEIRKGGARTMSIWHTKEFFTVVTKKGEEVTVPCDNAEEIISAVKPFLHK